MDNWIEFLVPMVMMTQPSISLIPQSVSSAYYISVANRPWVTWVVISVYQSDIILFIGKVPKYENITIIYQHGLISVVFRQPPAEL